MKIKAYGIFDGGGVKGAALAGCLKAAQDSGIEFAGYGGTSAGSIVALLAAVGYTGNDLKAVMTEKIPFKTLGAELKQPIGTIQDMIAAIVDLAGQSEERPKNHAQHPHILPRLERRPNWSSFRR